MTTPNLPHDVTVEQLATIEGDALFKEVWPFFEFAAEEYACRLTRNWDKRDDLVQVAKIEFWRLEPSRYDFNDPNDIKYVRCALRNRIYDEWGNRKQLQEKADELAPTLPIDRDALRREYIARLQASVEHARRIATEEIGPLS